MYGTIERLLYSILYHPFQANVVADALSRKAGSMRSLTHLQVSRRSLAREVQNLANDFMRLEVLEKGGFMACVEARSSFLDKIKGKQFTDEKLIRIRDKVLRGEAKDAKIDEEGVLRIKGRVCVPRVDDLIHTILTLPVEGKNFIVYCDASYFGLGAVLMQEKNVIAYPRGN